MFRRAIVRPPGRNFAHGITTAHLGRPDYALALQQHERYCAALEQCGLTLTRLDIDTRFPDSTFVEDTALLTARCAILTRPGAASRAGEVTSMREALVQFFPTPSEIQAPGTLDGGDICEAGSHFFIGVSARTNEEGARQLTSLLTAAGYTSTCVDIRGMPGLLHLKSGMAYLGDNRLVLIEALAKFEAFQGYERVYPALGEAYAANCVRVNNHVLVAAGSPTFEASIRTLGYQVITLEMSEFQKMDGGLSCLSLRF
ncbi:MAG: dimethylarginine dimethylaminohydrolase family protein [bacterium]